jgi:hypothetical protein
MSDSAPRIKRVRASNKYSAYTLTRWRPPLLEAVKAGAEASDMPVAAFIRAACREKLKRIRVPMGRGHYLRQHRVLAGSASGDVLSEE